MLHINDAIIDSLNQYLNSSRIDLQNFKVNHHQKTFT